MGDATKRKQIWISCSANLGNEQYDFGINFPMPADSWDNSPWATNQACTFLTSTTILRALEKPRSRRMLLDTWFTDTTFGMPGDEDGGGMSALSVFSMMGFYPVTPACRFIIWLARFFGSHTINLHNGKTLKIVCQNNSKQQIHSKRPDQWQPLNQVWSGMLTSSTVARFETSNGRHAK